MAQSEPAECGHLVMLKLPDVRVTEAPRCRPRRPARFASPHCRVNGVIGTEIRFSLLLPDTWNGKFLMGGGGGFVGTIQNQARATVNDGYRDGRHRHRSPGAASPTRAGRSTTSSGR